MDFTAKNKKKSYSPEELYRALAVGDLPAAWLIANSLEKTDPAAAFNCGLCLFLLEEWEKALDCFNIAERLIGNPPELEMSEKKLFLKAIETVGESAAFLPLDPRSDISHSRYGLIHIRWLTALCLLKLDRKQEAAPILRFLNQYISI